MKGLFRTYITLVLIWLMMPASFASARLDSVSHRIGENKTTIVPDTFLRGYDPITVFFPSSKGPDGGGPIDNPGDLFTITPNHPGEYRWIDGSTLQFLPTTRWSALQTYTVSIKDETYRLVTFMDSPRDIDPKDKSLNLEPIKDISLYFSDPISPDQLASMIRFEIQSLPGLAEEDGYSLTQKDFTLKQTERSSINEAIRYQLSFNKPIPYGMLITMHLKLCRDETVSGSLAHYTFATKPVFRLSSVGCSSVEYPVSTKGSVYSQDQALDCGMGKGLYLNFSDNLGPVSMDQIKKMVRFEPSIENFTINVSDKRILLDFKPKRQKAYRLNLQYVALSSETGRTLSRFGETSLYFYYRQAEPYLKWRTSQGILERYGPQVFPLEGRALEQLDLRIYKIDPLNLNFWPFPINPVALDEAKRPPGPGEEPDYGKNIREQIKLLGSPMVSTVVPLPTKPEYGGMQFGINLKDHLGHISGKDQPGAYLVGYRTIDKSTMRHYVRVQVTDLSLSTIEEESAVTFVVTSLKTGKPVKGATIKVEGKYSNKREDIISGTTDKNGTYRYEHVKALRHSLTRIIVSKDDDMLVLDTNSPPPHYIDNHWYGSYSTWLGWLRQEPRHIKESSTHKAHILTERPVYRPEEPVHIKGYVRMRQQGKIIKADRTRERSLLINGPGEKQWTFPISLNEYGSFYYEFNEKDLPTGDYTATIRDDKDMLYLANVTFKKESYRIPLFEVQVSGPDKVALDKPFDLTLSADYYSGGRVVGQDVTWQVTQFPHQQTLSGYPGFMFSSDERFSGSQPFRSSGSMITHDVTDDSGASHLKIDPSQEEDARPRRYVVEATVRGADEQSVSTTKSVLALPPFVLGIKLDRFIKQVKTISPQVIVLGHDMKELQGMVFHLKFYQRQWHSSLRETDFTTGKAEYITNVVDELIFEKDYVSDEKPKAIDLKVKEAGVYVVELTALDELGRMQKVIADAFFAGDEPIHWERPRANVFETVSDKKEYDPGETASIIMKSPFQNASALVIVEGPNENTYHWTEIKSGQGSFDLPISGDMTPRVAVHTLLLRGRLTDSGTGQTGGKDDRAKPIAMANTTWIKVKPKDNGLKLLLEHPPKALPGETMTIKIRMRDLQDKKLNGEVTLWLVDRAVLALGKERVLEPLWSFIDEVVSMLSIRETRNEVVGDLPVQEIPGGDGMKLAEGYADSLFQKVTVRKNFKTVPFFKADTVVKEGYAEVAVPLPDDLTDFAVRAVACDKESRFGSAKSMISIRLPVIVQSALPRFVRPGDSFDAGGIGRIVEGEAGPGYAEIKAQGIEIEGPQRKTLNWRKDVPERLYYRMIMPEEYEEDQNVTISLAVARDIDKAMDAFEVKLPVIRDKDLRRKDVFTRLVPGNSIEFPAPDEDVRTGTMHQSAVLTHEIGLIKMLAGLNYLSSYEHGCTEQRVSSLMPELALKDIFERIGREGRAGVFRKDIEQTCIYLESTLRPDGLYGCWPGSRGYVSLTAYVVKFLLLAREQGYEFKDELLERPLRALKESLRSDYNNFIDGCSYVERAEALSALAMANRFDESYAHELYARALTMDLNSEANILCAYITSGSSYTKAIKGLREDLWKSVVFKLREGNEVYEGLQYRSHTWGGLILSSEVKTLAGVTRSLYLTDQDSPRIKILVDELVNLGQKDGWGSTNANAAAMLAIGDTLTSETPSGQGHIIRASFGEELIEADTTGKPVTRITSSAQTPGRLDIIKGEPDNPPHAWLSVEYMPTGTGDKIKKTNKGFVVERNLLLIQDNNTPPLRYTAVAGETLELEMGAVIEEHVQVINAEERYYVAVSVPFAAGLEPLNPNLATAPPEAKPSGALTLIPSYALYADDKVVFYYDTLPKGAYDFYFRIRASFAGSFTHPAAKAEMMYKQEVRGNSDGTRIRIKPRQDEGRASGVSQGSD